MLGAASRCDERSYARRCFVARFLHVASLRSLLKSSRGDRALTWLKIRPTHRRFAAQSPHRLLAAARRSTPIHRTAI